MKKGAVAFIRMYVYLAVPHTFCAGYLLESAAKAPCARKQVKVFQT